VTDEPAAVDRGDGAAAGALEIPPMGPLKDYVRVLDDWVKGESCQVPYLDELLTARDFSDRERREFTLGRQGLWKLIPPITLAEIEESELEPAALLALGLAVVVQGQHGLATMAGEQATRGLTGPLRDVEKLVRYLSEELEAAGRRSAHGSIARLSALRHDLQEQRRVLGQRDQGLAAAASLDASTGIASARIGDHESLASRIMGRLRRVTGPGFALFRAAVTPGGPVALVPEQEWNVDPQVPTPLGLYHYVASLDHWVARTAMDEPFLESLVRILRFGDAERAAFRAGRAGLWGLVPPIDAGQVAEADLDPASARALGVAMVFWARHLLAYYAPDQPEGVPPEIRDAAEIATAMRLVLGHEWGVDSESVIGARLFDLGLDLEARGAVGVSALEERRAAIVRARFDEVDARRLREMEAFEAARRERFRKLDKGRRISVLRVGLGVAVLVVALVVWLAMPDPEYLPPAKSYGELPAVAIIRHREQITIRVDLEWLALPLEQREGQMGALWERFGREMERPEDPVDLSVVSRKNKPLGGFKLGFAWWDPSVQPPDEPEEAPPEEPAPETGSG
jgi:hypothetical protein